MTTILGIDIGGTGIKGAPVDLERGELSEDRLRIPTPEGGSPGDVARVVAEVAAHFDVDGPIGCTFPAVIRRGVALTAANVDNAWIGNDAQALFTGETGRPVTVVNDADAAGLAEMQYGAGKGRSGTVVMLTLGTGIGSAVFTDGRLVPNTEFGHLDIRGKAAERRASEKAREDHDLSWERWAQRLNEVLTHLEALLWPDLFVVGGGVSKKHDQFLHLLETRAEVVPAQLLNQAGIVGAALAARGRA
ncbi:MAG: ROK family protein [Actinobacteria bacterium]|nr:ROK family protein [Actinomycetota bacterium]